MGILPVGFIYIAALLRLGGGFAYIVATIRGKAKPTPISWLLWSLTPLSSFFAGLSNGFDPMLVVTLATGLSPLMVFFIAIAKNRRSLQFNKLNTACLIIALTGIGLWAATDHPLLAIGLAIVADIVSALPTLAKIARHPYSEYTPTYIVNAGAMALALLATDTLSPLAIAFPVYVLTINSFIVGFILSVQAKRKMKIRQGLDRAHENRRARK